MDRNVRKPARGEPDASPPSESWLFAQALLGKPIPNPASVQAEARAKREHLEWLASFSTEHAAQLRRLQSEEAEARHRRELLQWLATFSTEHERELRRLQAREAEAFDAQANWERFHEDYSASLAEWNEIDHPRNPKGTPDGGQWVAKGGGSGDASGSPLFLAAVIRRNQTIAELTGIVTPGMIRSTRIAAELQSAASLPGEVARAAAAGLGTGGKAVVNGFATAVKSVATLGLDTSQLELIGVSKEDRDRGYDTAAAISTASGQVLIAVGTGGLTSALSKGGSVARTGSGALVAYDAAGNAVGVIKGVVDATQNRISLSNGAQVVGGLLGLGANFKAARGLNSAVSARRFAEIDEFVATLPRKNTPIKSAANQYEVKYTGQYNYTLSGGGETFNIDGYRGPTILEAKHVDKPRSSPYVPGSTCPEPIRNEIVGQIREELRKVRTIIESGSTPFSSLEIITNSPEAKTLFEGLLKEMRVPGTVQIQP